MFLNKLVLLLSILVTISACTPLATSTSHPRPTPTPAEILPTASPTGDTPPTKQKLSSVPLRFEFQTTSDWSDIVFLSPEKTITIELDNPFQPILERGDLIASTLKIYHLQNGETKLIQEIYHDRQVLDQLGRNPVVLGLDLSSISVNGFEP